MPPSSRKLATGEAPVVTAAAATPAEKAEPEGVLMRFVQHLMTPGSSLSGTMWVAFNIIMFVLFVIWLMFLFAFPDVVHVYIFGFLGCGLMCSTNFLLYQVIFNMPKEEAPAADADAAIEETKNEEETLAVEEAVPTTKTTEKVAEKVEKVEKKAEKAAEKVEKKAEKVAEKVEKKAEKVAEKAEVAEKKAEVAAAVEEVVTEVVEARSEATNTKSKGVKKGVPAPKEEKVEVVPAKEVEAATPEPEAAEPEAAAVVDGEDAAVDESAPAKRPSKRPVARRNGKSAPRDN